MNNQIKTHLTIALLLIVVLITACTNKAPHGWEKIERKDFVLHCPKDWIDSTTKTIDLNNTRVDLQNSFSLEKVMERIPDADKDGVEFPLKKKTSDGITMIVYEQPRSNMADCKKRYDSCYVDKTFRDYKDVKFKELDAKVFNAQKAYEVHIRPLMHMYHDVYDVFLLGKTKDVWVTVYCLSEKNISTADSIIQTIRIKE